MCLTSWNNLGISDVGFLVVHICESCKLENMLIFYSALKCIFKMRCLHRIPVTVIKAYADCLIQNICLSIMIIEFMHLHHRLKYDQMLKLPSAHKHGHCQTLHILTLNKTRVLPGLERHDPQACKRRKYTREQVKYISIFTT